MTTARSPAWLLALGLLLAAACGEPERKLLSSLGGPTEFDTSATDPSKGEGGGIGEWVTPSSKLGCGQPCDDHDVTADGWCADSGVAVRCEAGVVVCEECGAVGRDCTVGDAAPARCLRACDGEEVCPPGGECFTLQCCGNARWCERNAQAICSPDGGNLKVQECLEGLDCIDGQCVPARPLVHVLFDTSGSMTWNPHTGGEVPGDWPACDDPQNPQSRLGISKRAFSELFSDVQYDHVLFSLQRFPQRLDALLLPMCPGGAYETQDKITGHKGIYVIGDDETGAWFTENLGEVLLVPFPKASFDSNRDELTAWLDFAELSTTTTDACNAHSDCAGGLCTAPGTASGGVCRTFENPELRALGWTPLGTSLYYAAEYFRKYVVVDGAPCLLNVDCLSATYICDNGTCRDPNRFCRQRSIVVFTDGVDTASLGAWLDPVVQAKRLRAGLDCTATTDCGAGFVCDGGTCQNELALANPCAPLQMSCPREERKFPDAVKAGAERLRDANGQPIQIAVHVVDAGGVQAETAPIAAYGGGLHIPADLASPTSLLKGVQGVVNWKDASFCTPR